VSEQSILDMVWHHVHLHELCTDDGTSEDFRLIPNRFDQLKRAAAFMHTTLAIQPITRFYAVGELKEYESPLLRSEWLLP